MTASLVDREISRQKLLRELERWESNEHHRERGWVLLGVDSEALVVEIAFLAAIATSVGPSRLPVVVCAIRLTYQNYDLWPPSLTFTDVFTRQPTRPHVRALQGSQDGEFRDVLIDAHPDTQQPFICLAGIREYHTHPQHTGDHWLLHRRLGEGSLSTICDRIWLYMVKTVIGVNVGMQVLPAMPMRAQVHLVLAQGEIKAGTQPTTQKEVAPPSHTQNPKGVPPAVR